MIKGHQDRGQGGSHRRPPDETGGYWIRQILDTLKKLGDAKYQRMTIMRRGATASDTTIGFHGVPAFLSGQTEYRLGHRFFIDFYLQFTALPFQGFNPGAMRSIAMRADTQVCPYMGDTLT